MRLRLDRLAKNRVFMDHLRWDVTPDVIFRPRFASTAVDRERMVRETQGFTFYIDYCQGLPPNLMVMKTYNLTSKTVGEVQDAPPDLLMAAVRREGVKDYCGMYPIDEAVEGWLKKGLGLTP